MVAQLKRKPSIADNPSCLSRSRRAMRSLPTVIASRDGERAFEVVHFDGVDRIANRDATGYYFRVRLEPDGELSRLAVIFSGTVLYLGPESLGLADIEDRDERFVQYSLAAMGDFIDDYELPPFTPSGTTAFHLECFSGHFQDWMDRKGADDDVVESYLRSHVFWAWKYDQDILEIGAPDRLRLSQSFTRIEKLIRLGEGTDWSVESRSEVTVGLRAEAAFVSAVRKGEAGIVIHRDATASMSLPEPSEPLESQGAPSPLQFVDQVRVADLKRVPRSDFDLGKLISLCEELNVCYRSQCYHAVAALTRAVIDHVPPVLGCKLFGEVVNNYSGGRSFSDSMKRLEGVRKIADAHLHTHIRRTEALPTRVQVNFSAELDVLLGEVHRVLVDKAKDGTAGEDAT